MSLTDWVPYRSEESDMKFDVETNQDTRKKVLSFRGTVGEVYLIPEKKYGIRGHLSGCFRTLYTKKLMKPLDEIRIYCMMSADDVRTTGSCYVASLNTNRQVYLRKYTQGLINSGETLVCLRLPANYKRGVFGLMWIYDPLVRSGVFFRGLLSVNPEKPEETYRLFDCVDTDNPLLSSEGEGFGVYSSQDESGITEIHIERTALHKIQYGSTPEPL